MNWTVTIHENDEVAARLDEGVRDGIGKRIPGEKRPCWMSNRLFIGLKYGGRGKGGLGEGFSFRPVNSGGLTPIGAFAPQPAGYRVRVVSIPFFIPISKQLVRRKSSWQRRLLCSGRGKVRYSGNYGMHYRRSAHGTV